MNSIVVESLIFQQLKNMDGQSMASRKCRKSKVKFGISVLVLGDHKVGDKAEEYAIHFLKSEEKRVLAARDSADAWRFDHKYEVQFVLGHLSDHIL